MSDEVTLRARCDRDDLLIEGDAGFAALNERAGGAPGHPLAVPQLATVVRLARRLRIPVQRPVTLADAELDLDCWVRATPDDDGVALRMMILRERIAERGRIGTATVLTATPVPAGADWTWSVDPQLRLTALPADVAAAVGVDPVEALGKPLTWLFALDDAEDGILPILEAAAARRDFDDQRAKIRRTGQSVLLAGSVRHSAGGVFAGFAGATFLQAGVASDTLLLGETIHARLDTVLRPPLGRIVAAADALNGASEGPIDPHYADYAADIAHAGRHLIGLVDDLADLEAIERPDFSIETETIDLADVMRRARGLLSVRAADAGVTIDDGGLSQEFTVTADFGRTLQIVINLLSNAIRYSPRGATIWIRLQNDGARVATIVADQGKGIAREDQARIFEKFERVDTDEPGGSGLGLYISRRLARAMKGDLTVDSDTGQGARFILTLLAAKD